MKKYQITEKQISAYIQQLQQEEKAQGTLEKYMRDLHAFVRWAETRPVTKQLATDWKDYLLERQYAPITINSMLAALNGFFHFLGWDAFKVRFLKIQRRVFRRTDRELIRSDFDRLLKTAQSRGQERLALLMETICSTGIRVSEVRYITVEAAKLGRAEISLKGKIRTILLPSKLCSKLLKYAKKTKSASGEIFLTKNGTSLSRRQIWTELKRLCAYAGVEPSKVFPHNMRHVFATIYYKASKDIAQLADMLGHSSIETTRIYLITSGKAHSRQLERLGIVS